MAWIDYLILGIVALSSVISLIRGFVKEAFSLCTWFFAFFVARFYYQDIAAYLENFDTFSAAFSDQLVKNGVAIAILFICTLILGALLNYILAQLVSKTGLSGTDRLLGVCFGLARGVLVVCVLLLFLQLFTRFPEATWWQNSPLIAELKPLIKWFFEHQASAWENMSGL
ncbi:MAG: membrane protein required for colicin V production [Moritella sp.]|jgi:membrane protein required for colicin V production